MTAQRFAEAACYREHHSRRQAWEPLGRWSEEVPDGSADAGDRR